MASETKVTLQTEQVPEGDSASPVDRPLFDSSDAAIKKLVQTVKKRGYVTHHQINSVLSSEEANSDQIENVLAMLSGMGINVVETEEASEGEKQREDVDEEEPESTDDEGPESTELVEVTRAVPAKMAAKEPAGRTDDPVRMYMREMGSMELLSREGEIAIAKRIEAGREAMIGGLCESRSRFRPLSSGATSSTKERSFCATSSISKPPMPVPMRRPCSLRSSVRTGGRFSRYR